MSFGKFVISNIVGTVFVALLGLLMGVFISWIAGFFLPESYKPIVAGVVFVLFMLGVPSIWVQNWRKYQLMKLMASDYEEDGGQYLKGLR